MEIDHAVTIEVFAGVQDDGTLEERGALGTGNAKRPGDGGLEAVGPDAALRI